MTKGYDFTGKQLQITAKKNGFRRGGISHPSTPTTHNPDDFTADQIVQLLNEPELVVVVLDEKNAGSSGETQLSEDEQIEKVAAAIKELEAEGKNINVANLTAKAGFKVSGAIKDKAVEKNKQTEQ